MRRTPESTPNKRTQERVAAMQEAAKKIQEAPANAFEGDGHALLVSIYKDPARPIELRMDAAKATIAYEKPRLAATELSGGLAIKTHEDWLRELQDRVAESDTDREEPATVRD